MSDSPIHEKSSFQLFAETISSELEFLDKLFDNGVLPKSITSDSLENKDYQKNRDKIITECNKFLHNSFFTLNNNILDGSYIISDLSKEVDNVKINLNDLIDFFQIYYSNTKFDKIFQDFINDLFRANIALNFLNKLLTNLFYKDANITYSLSTSTHDSFEKTFNKDLFALNSVEILVYNIFLINADHYLNIADEVLIAGLEDIYKGTKKLKLDPSIDETYIFIPNLIYLKSSFLRKKILLRNSEEIISFSNNEFSSKKLLIQSKNEFSKFSADKIIQTPSLVEFKDWLEYDIYHYELDKDSKINIERKASSQKLDFKNPDIKFLDIHLHIKYNKDILADESFNKAFDNLIEIKNYLKGRLSKSSNNSFDEYCLITNVTYCYNNIFSLLVKYNKGKELLENYEEFLNTNRLAERSNYFAKGTLLSYYANELEVIFNKENINLDISRCNEIVTKCKDLVDKFNNELLWFQNHNNYVFILPKNEATININSKRLYIYSSFVLPTSSNYLLHKFEKSVRDINFYTTSFKSISALKSSLDNISSLESRFIDLNNEFNNTKTKLEEKENKTIEIVALISSILAFVAGSIPAFKFINTGEEAIYFTLSLGSSLVLFSLLLFGLNRGFESLKKIFFVTVPLIIFSWFLLFIVSSDKLHFKENENYCKKQIKKESSKPKANTIKSKNK